MISKKPIKCFFAPPTLPSVSIKAIFFVAKTEYDMSIPTMKLNRKVWLVLSNEKDSNLDESQLASSCNACIRFTDLAPFESALEFHLMHELRLLPFSLSEIYQFDGLMQHRLLKGRFNTSSCVYW
jgi:hypothetical protein